MADRDEPQEATGKVRPRRGYEVVDGAQRSDQPVGDFGDEEQSDTGGDSDVAPAGQADPS
jgi:hypothetical protein